MRGQVPVNYGNLRLTLFDGQFDTAYRVEKFEIVGSSPLDTVEFIMKLSTDELTDISAFNYNDNTEIAWAMWGGAHTTLAFSWSDTDPDNLIIEDLFLSCRGGTDNTFCNYIITLQKYEIDDWRGALGMVRNRSQS